MLTVRVLGQFQVELHGRPVEITSRPAQSLFAYLLLNAGVPQSREKLAGQFWPDAAEENARSNLRHALWRIRKALGAEYFFGGEPDVAFDAAVPHWLDAAILDTPTLGSAPLDALLDDLSVYRGPLLPGFYDDWVLLERERLDAVFERKMHLLLDRLVEAGHWSEVLDWGERWIAHGATPEPAYRALMTAYSELGNTSSVAAVFRRLVRALCQELGLEPSAQTSSLYRRLAGQEPPLIACDVE